MFSKLVPQVLLKIDPQILLKTDPQVLLKIDSLKISSTSGT